MPNALSRETPGQTEQEEAPRLQLSLVQVIAAALASVTSAVILSRFGAAGTYAGTAVGSIVSTVSVALYSHTMRQARRRVRTYAHHHHGRRVIEAPPVRTPPAAWNRSHPRGLPAVTVRTSRPRRAGWLARWDRLERWFGGLPLWSKAGLMAATAFVVAVVAVVLFQFLSGHSLANAWGMGTSSNGPNAGCVIESCGGTTPTPASMQSPAPTSATTPQPTQQPSLAPTTQPTPVATPFSTPVATPAPSVAPSVAPSAFPTLSP